jgi:threonine/homoserine/homoserine lactone efflux protein
VEALLTILPLAFVMIAGPQIISATLLATSEEPRRNSLGFIAGVFVATTIGVTVLYFVVKAIGGRSDSARAGNSWIDYALIALLAFLAVRVFLKRKESEPPRWMGRVQTATPRFSFLLGFLLFTAMPTDVLTMFSVASYLVDRGAAWWRGLPFVVLTCLFIATPLLMLLLLGRRAEILLPRVRDWMNANSWVISEIVIVFFLVMTIKGLD